MYNHNFTQVFTSRSGYYHQILMQLEFSRQICKRYSNIKFDENPTSKSHGVPCRRMDGRKGRHDEAKSRFSQFCARA